jgi:hypothetical protein
MNMKRGGTYKGYQLPQSNPTYRSTIPPSQSAADISRNWVELALGLVAA